VRLWGVWQDDDSAAWVLVTAEYENGRQKGAVGAHDSLTGSLDVDHPYTIDQTGTIVVTEDSGYQYYQVDSVVNGIIMAKDGDSFPLTDESWWFTTRASAEEFLASQTGSGQVSLQVASGDKWRLYDYSQSKWISFGEVPRERLVALLKGSPNAADTIERLQGFPLLSQDVLDEITIELTYFGKSSVLSAMNVSLGY